MVFLLWEPKRSRAGFKRLLPREIKFVLKRFSNSFSSSKFHSFETSSPISSNFHLQKAGPRSNTNWILLSSTCRLTHSTDPGERHRQKFGLPCPTASPLVSKHRPLIGQIVVPNHFASLDSLLSGPIHLGKSA
ncbi:hypothetical protein LguiB_031110 [Lonicera macranthoides]